MISTNPSTVSGLIWTNERCPLCYLQVSEDNLTVATTGSHGTFILPTSLRVDQTYSLVSSSVSLLVICKIFSSKNIQNIFSGPPPGAPPPPRYPEHPHFLQNKAETAPIQDWHHALLKTQLRTPKRAILAFHSHRNYYGCFYALKTLGGGLWYFNLCLYGIREQAIFECES